MRPWISLIAFTLCFLLIMPRVSAQLGKITLDLDKDKPVEYKEKVLKSEKTGDKKFTIPRRIMNNTTSHYNYFFNANNKLNAVIERARISNKDNYAKLIPFYGYSIANTALQGSELDSVIYKCTAGILLHDLRSDWVDNLYLLIGKAYLLRNYLDSAAMTFQFINYTLYPHRKLDDDQIVVGSNDNGGSVMSIANKEKRSLPAKIFTLPPSRNDALVWQIRTSIEELQYSDAAGLINTLQNDPNFPKRLRSSLEEVDAYWFYKQAIYDSAAYHLEKALGHAEDQQDKARWEFLLAQMYEINKEPVKASEYYNKAAKHTTDPLMDIYANLNNAKMYKGKDPKELEQSIYNLLRMARRDKFENYRDIIFFSAGELELEKPDTALAEAYYKKSVKYNQNNISYKNRAFLTLAEINFKQKNYRLAQAFYDSLQTSDTSLANLDQIQDRKKALTKLVAQITIIEREDSLQKIAAMSPADREAFIKRLSKKLTKEKGGNDDDITSSGSFLSSTDIKNQSADLFANNTTTGDWYFYNPDIKAKGFNEFRSKWGKRSNIDNWRRRSVSDLATSSQVNTKLLADSSAKKSDKVSVVNADDFSYDAMLANVPITAEKLKVSNTLVETSLFQLGKVYQNDLEDYALAVDAYQTSLTRYPDSLHGGELYLNLYFCYEKLGDINKANFYKNLLTTKFKNSALEQMVNNPAPKTLGSKNPEATRLYENIYNEFLEGNFARAVDDKKRADSLYGNNYWSPQLLYIESVYYIKQRQDSMAISVLNAIVTKYPSSPLKTKAVNMIAVLKRRAEIETYLTNLQVTRLPEDSLGVIDNSVAVNPVVRNPVVNNPVNNIPADSSKQVVKVVPPPAIVTPSAKGGFSFDMNSAQYVVMVLDKVDGVYINEARNAFNRYNLEKYSDQHLIIVRDALDKDKTILIISKFSDANVAFAYEERLKKDAPSEVSWLPVSKYSFLIISDANLQLLKENKDLSSYRSLLNIKFPGKF